jgi:hypothetical protein
MLSVFLCLFVFGAVALGAKLNLGSSCSLQSFLLRRKGFPLPSGSRWAGEALVNKHSVLPIIKIVFLKLNKKSVPNLYIIAGCNGAGKTTASFTVLPEMLSCNEFVNADEIARGLSPFQPETVSIQAGRIMLERINELIERGVDFAI